MKKTTPASTAAALQAAELLETVAKNVRVLAAVETSPLNAESVTQLAEGGQWVEIVDRFWRTLAFGTGGLRGRTIGRVVTAGEQGKAAPGQRPDNPCSAGIGGILPGMVCPPETERPAENHDRA